MPSADAADGRSGVGSGGAGFLDRFPAGDARPWVLLGLVLLVLVSAAGFAWDPWLTFGILLGALLFGLTVLWPLGVVAAMLAIGPLDLSFLTGGFKSMFQQLGGLDMNGIRLVFVSAGLGLVVLSDRSHWARLREPPALLYLVFLAYGVATLAVSPDPLEGLRLFMKLAWPLLIFLVVSAPDRTWSEIDRLTDWFLVGAAVIIVINPLFIFLGDVYVEQQGQVRFMGAGTHQNPFSFAMLVAMLVALVRFGFRGEARYLLLAFGAAAWIGLTQTRITFLAAAVSLGVVALYAAVVRRNLRTAALGLTAAVLLTLALSPLILERTFGTIPSWGELWNLLQHPVALYQSINWSGRELFWAVLVFAWMQSPWLGLGLGSSTTILVALFQEEMGQVAHNEYIRLGTDTGFIGLGLYAVAMLAWVRVSLEAGRTDDPRVQQVALPALAIMVSWAVISITDNAFDYYGPFTQYAGFFVGASLVSGTWTRDRS